MDPAQPSSRIPLPIFPLEIWIQILSSITKSADLPGLWQNCRLVSHVFKAATERAFYERHLPRTCLIYETFHAMWTAKHGLVQDFRLDLRYDGLSDDGTRAFFEDKITSLRDDVLNDKVMHTKETVLSFFRDQWEKQLANAAFPLHLLVVRRICRDTALPGLQVDPVRFRASFLWREALARLFGECVHEIKLMDRPHEEVVGSSLAVNFPYYIGTGRDGINPTQHLVRGKYSLAKTMAIQRVMLQERVRRLDEATLESQPNRDLATFKRHVLDTNERIVKLHPMEISDEEPDGVDWKSMEHDIRCMWLFFDSNSCCQVFSRREPKQPLKFS